MSSPDPWIEPVLAFVDKLQANVRLADLLDIAVIAFCLYWAMLWLRERRSRAAAAGFFALVFVYVVSRRLDMYLTSLLFQVGITAVLVALAVVFQNDLRRIVDRMATLSPFQTDGPPAAPAATTFDVVTEAVVLLARHRIGALLVFAGREPIDTHLRGGVEVGGRVSVPLLYSIFDPHSPGHDGAVLIAGDRVVKLGVHLPLPEHAVAVGGRGTRHAAALGLAERSDALTVVVSEEQGTVSIARAGRLETLESAAELKPRLEAFQRSAFPPSGARRESWARRNPLLKLSALALACLLWLVFAFRVEALERTFSVPIVYRSLTQQVQPPEPRPTSAEVTLYGSERVFDLLDPSTMEISLDLDEATGDELAITPGDVNRPSGLAVIAIDPPTVPLRHVGPAQGAPARPPAAP